MKAVRCPYHVKQGLVDTNGKLVLSDICGVKAAEGARCSVAPFTECAFGSCPRFIAHSRGLERQMLIPKDDLEYLPELGGTQNFSELDLM